MIQHAYMSAVRATWPQMDVDRIQRLASIGYLFRLLASVYWAALASDMDGSNVRGIS